MNPFVINDVLTIADRALVYSEQEKNKIDKELKYLTTVINTAREGIHSKLENAAKELFMQSKYYEPFKVLYGETLFPQFHIGINVPDKNDAFQYYPLYYLGDKNSVGIYQIFFMLTDISDNQNRRLWYLLGEINLATFFDIDLTEPVKRMSYLIEESKKDFEKIFRVNLIAQKMVQDGEIQGTITIPEIPTLILNENLK